MFMKAIIKPSVYIYIKIIFMGFRCHCFVLSRNDVCIFFLLHAYVFVGFVMCFIETIIL